ncbi:MAG TPA: hypothetical protein VFO79_15890 [Xanthomonadales bacterium]|nr:hypothetical protein [Xanthomonadales bacterium]
MKTPFLIVGVLLVAFGIASLLGMLEFTDRKEVLKIGEFEASVERQRTIPQWAGIASIVAGVVLVVVGATRRGR